jgi:hypothetical protein
LIATPSARIPGAAHANYVTSIFEEEASTREDFVFAKPVGKT